MHKLVLFDIGHVLVQLTGASLIKRLAKKPIRDDHIHSTWLSIPGVTRFETGKCEVSEFASGVIDFYDLQCTEHEFATHFRNAAEGKFEGVDDYLVQLADTHELACLTNTNPLQWPKIRDDFGLGEHFSKQYVSYQLGLMKPGAEIFDHVLSDTELLPEEILFIDDNIHNCKTAQMAGFDICHVSSFENTVEQVNAKLRYGRD
jgi:glucose-1-phosphatase